MSYSLSLWTTPWGKTHSRRVKILKRTFLPTNLEFASPDMVGLYFKDESHVDAGDEEIATLQTEYFSKSFQKPVLSHLEKTENLFEEDLLQGECYRHAELVS